ncbi:MAG: hypothetical protein F6J97_13640 [Leptolyngbya sp. SIO4C1]|nr:hypothetical protein [Leptolyngbya sp. SIO4C1]
MVDSRLVQLLAFPGWIVGISHTPAVGYRCWVITPELSVLNDGEVYRTRQAALQVGCELVRQSL